MLNRDDSYNVVYNINEESVSDDVVLSENEYNEIKKHKEMSSGYKIIAKELSDEIDRNFEVFCNRQISTHREEVMKKCVYTEIADKRKLKKFPKIDFYKDDEYISFMDISSRNADEIFYHWKWSNWVGCFFVDIDDGI